MSRERLSNLLADLAEDVEPIQHLEHSRRAWAAARTRRQRRAMLGAGVAVLLVAAPVAVTQLDGPEPVRPGPSSTYLGTVRVDTLPARLTNVTPDGWPTALDPPADAPTLSQRRAPRPLLAFQPHWAGPIYLYSQLRTGDPGMSVRGWVRLDVDLKMTRDPVGDQASPLDVNSLAHSGEYLAFAQPDEYVIVEPATGEVRRFPLPGLNEEVAWLPGVHHQLLIAGDGRTTLANVETATVALPAFDLSAYDVVLAPYDNRDLVMTLALDSGSVRLRHFQLPGGVPALDLAITEVAGFVPTTLLGRAWASGDRIAQGFHDRTRAFVAVIDATTGVVTHVLVADDQRTGCCQVVGWLDGDSVLISSDDGVLAWHLPSGAVTIALPYSPGALSLAP